MNKKNQTIRNFVSRINTQKLLLIMKSIKWDIVIIILAIAVFSIIKITLMPELYPVKSRSTTVYIVDSENNNSFSISHKKDYSYEVSRDIFNFSKTRYPAFVETNSLSTEFAPAEGKQSPSLHYKGIIIMGAYKAAAFTVSQKEYTAIEGEIIENQYKLLKIENDYIEVLNITSDKQLRILKEDFIYNY
ncbi:MAG: hypothetical protein A2Y62_21310 [Candidatus Fischerbacteria bacterium RBG_13_37_8]|uniref:Uncharacterized protein n=1 Tax=Candidatus Fischerbacteria bacterium RBG_13_37_8 TaxID=1817863 RepID=A0A1F5VP28_9BACT|nr:MAG: hypothetical protein A2Y62_21310 [Candidatus Fischerbacteria bacterium RBG_13_37_8]